MASKLKAWVQKKRKPLIIIAVIAAFAAVLALIFLGYRFNETGFTKKTLWDWLQLLIIPAVLAVGGYLFSFTASRNERKASDRHNQTEREIAQDNQHETAFQEYIDKMSELLLDRKLRESQPEDEVRKIARVRTLTVLPRLDGKRKGSVLQFLYESGLIDKDKSILDLNGADLSKANLIEADLIGADLIGADLREANLREANLSGVDLSGADLSGAILSKAILYETKLSRVDLIGADVSGADFSGAYLGDANLSGANLSEADLSGANLKNAKVTLEQLEKAISLKGATMPDGSTHP